MFIERRRKPFSDDRQTTSGGRQSVGDHRYRSAHGFPPVAAVFQVIYFAGNNVVRNGGKYSRENRPPPQLNFPADILAL